MDSREMRETSWSSTSKWRPTIFGGSPGIASILMQTYKNRNGVLEEEKEEEE